MLELAEHIIAKKSGKFDPAAFDDQYEASLAEVVKAKIEGRKIVPRVPVAKRKVVDLLSALRESAGQRGAKDSKRKIRVNKSQTAERRKAG